MLARKARFGEPKPLVHPAVPVLVVISIIGLVLGVVFRQQLGLPLTF